MLSFDAPLWLLGLPTLILVWWLHRRSGSAEEQDVPALFLWRGLSAGSWKGPPHRKASPIWMLRAAVISVLVLALAGPRIRDDGPIIVWFDDSISMATLEQDVPRTAVAIERIYAELDGRPARLRSVRDHDRQFPLETTDPSRAKQRVSAWTREERESQARVHLDGHYRHWLVTDGSDAQLNALARASKFDRLIVVGTERENAGVVRLALRRSLLDPNEVLGVVGIENGGTRHATRTLSISSSNGEQLRRDLDLPPGAKTQLSFAVTSNSRQVIAKLDPTDALTVDDRLALTMQELATLEVRVSGPCDKYLVGAIDAHPGMEIVGGDATADLALLCGMDAMSQASTSPAVRWFGNPSGELHDLWLSWPGDDEAAEFLRYPIVPRPALPLDSDARVLARAVENGAPVAVANHGLVDVHLDVVAPPLASATGTLQLIGRVFDEAAGQRLLDPILASARRSGEVAVGSRLQSADMSIASPTELPGREMLVWLVILALVLIAGELALLTIQAVFTPGLQRWR